MREHRRTNRTLLALVGLTLLGGGLLVLAGGADIYRRWNLSPPGGWPLTTRHDVLVPGADQTRWVAQDWWWPATFASLAALMVLALVWLLAQSRRRRPRRLPVAENTRHHVTISDGVLGEALTDDLDTVTGVRRARARLRGPRSHPQAQIDLTLDPAGVPVRVLEGVPSATERARRSVRWDELPAHVHLAVARHGSHRVE
ncbi:alkaline shock response membrane anchor protein AmaP [Streptomyces sp. V4-01]|uniref:Alkaline shock response membrane anchor protein AmaP n=1 Tax=Actinacidiphila polyblastidii TaxID=3110430 RepID=A0ABU7PKG8_9ACTN|nr:alkaline shock response membrane anchor protein AmaP [Streptomyces sp. V4-01]